MDLVIVIPTLNEERGIKSTLQKIKDVLENKLKYVVVVVDGLSTDKTVEIAKSAGAKVIYQRRKGYGDALQAGFYYTDTRLNSFATAMMDADGTYDPIDILEMHKMLKNGLADFVIGNRLAKMDKNAMTKLNVFGNKILSALARKLLKISVTDSQCGIRLFRSDLASIFYTRAAGMPFATEMLVLASSQNIRIKEIPVLYHQRIGETKLNPLQDGGRILGTIIRLLRDTRPLVLFGSIGFILIGFGLLFGAEVIEEWLRTGTVVRIARAVLSGLFILLGAQSLTLGLVADMLKDKTHDSKVFYREE